MQKPVEGSLLVADGVRKRFGQTVALNGLSLKIRGGEVVAEARARAWLGRLDVIDHAGKRAGEMSGGEGQRVAVARALAIGPRVIFADEPTGSLDSLNGEVVMELLVSAARDQGTTVVLVTHEARVAAYADREGVVRDGRLAETPVLR